MALRQTLLGMMGAVLLLPSVAVAAEGSAMPQLDPTYFPSQLFWLAVTGAALYLLMSQIALPNVMRMVQARDDQARLDLEAAFKLKQEAEDIRIAYSKTLRDADEQSHALLERLVIEQKEKHYAALATGAAHVAVQITDIENKLRADKERLEKDIPEIAGRLSQLVIFELTKVKG